MSMMTAVDLSTCPRANSSLHMPTPCQANQSDAKSGTLRVGTSRSGSRPVDVPHDLILVAIAFPDLCQLNRPAVRILVDPRVFPVIITVMAVALPTLMWSVREGSGVWMSHGRRIGRATNDGSGRGRDARGALPLRPPPPGGTF